MNAVRGWKAGPRVAALAMTLSIAACGTSTGPTGRVEPIEALPRDLTPGERLVIDASNRFGFDLLDDLFARTPDENTFLSPLSAHAALSMALAGAQDSTLDAMRQTLGYTGTGSPSREDILAAYDGLADVLLDLDEKVELGIANSAWLEQSFPFRTTYVDDVREAFDARVEALDFTDAATPSVINQWVDSATGGRIPTMIEQIKPGDVLYLLNAIYFKGGWTDRFDPADTRDAPFTLADGSTKTVRMMSREKGELAVWHGSDVTVVDLPYGGAAFRFTVVLPEDGRTLSEVVAGLDAAQWDTWMTNLAEADVPVHLPRFELEWAETLNDALQALGMSIAFAPGEADFGGMLADGFDPQVPGTDLHITEVKQKTFLTVNEEGTEAAASTSVGVGRTALPTPIEVDRPFLLAIRERLSGTVFFLGAIVDPPDS